jgi:hypothetical protein
MSILGRSLDILFEEQDPRGDNPVDKARELRNQLAAAQQEVANLESQLKIVMQRLNGDLALGIRRQHPALNVGVCGDGCKVGYKTKQFMINPDVEKGVWTVASPDNRFLNKYTKNYAPHTLLNPQLDEFIKSIMLHFSNHFKTLGEEVIGTGIIIVEGKKSTLLELARWRNKRNLDRPIMSRSVRRQLN